LSIEGTARDILKVSNARFRKEDDEEALKWAAIYRETSNVSSYKERVDLDLPTIQVGSFDQLSVDAETCVGDRVKNDLHIGELTVRETLAFSSRCQGVGPDMVGDIFSSYEL
uniref:Uncharacterized protein n=1 Tax=Solanum lycopersicum TaxID=4081 RepID=A0A3Q7GRR8_SOLLC